MACSAPEMLTMTRLAERSSFCGAAVMWLTVAALSTAAASIAVAADNAPGVAPATAQQAPAAPAAPAAAAPTIPPQPPSPDRPGFLHQLKVWWDDSLGFFGETFKDTRGKVDDLNKKSSDAAKGVASTAQDAMKGALDVSKDAAAVTQGAMKGAFDVSKDAAAALLRLPNTRVVQVHAPCEKAPNGAPDCAKAAVNACRGKGFTTGQPLDVRTAEKCDTTQAFLQGQSPGKGECPIESWITGAVCQ